VADGECPQHTAGPFFVQRATGGQQGGPGWVYGVSGAKMGARSNLRSTGIFLVGALGASGLKGARHWMLAVMVLLVVVEVRH